MLSPSRWNNVVGPNCSHFLVVDITEAPESAGFEAAWSSFYNTMWDSDVRKAKTLYDRYLAGERMTDYSTVQPHVTYELGHYYWGISTDDMAQGDDADEGLRQGFPKQVREFCANPFQIRLESLTRSSPESPPRAPRP
jgi:hypothetical protein